MTDQQTDPQTTPSAAAITCWRCGKDRPAGSAWCPSCSAPIGPKDAGEKRKDKRRVWIIAGIAAVVVAGLWIGAAVRGPDQGGVSHAEYVQLRAECEDAATRSLPDGFAVGGAHWTDSVNNCMVDRAADRNP